jgi:hypothetical protein
MLSNVFRMALNLDRLQQRGDAREDAPSVADSATTGEPVQNVSPSNPFHQVNGPDTQRLLQDAEMMGFNLMLGLRGRMLASLQPLPAVKGLMLDQNLVNALLKTQIRYVAVHGHCHLFCRIMLSWSHISAGFYGAPATN